MCLWACAYEWCSFQLLAKVTLLTDSISVLISSSAYENGSPEWYMSLALKYSELICRGIVISSKC